MLSKLPTAIFFRHKIHELTLIGNDPLVLICEIRGLILCGIATWLFIDDAKNFVLSSRNEMI